MFEQEYEAHSAGAQVFGILVNENKAVLFCLIQYSDADFLWEVILKFLNSGIILKTFTHDSVPERNFEKKLILKRICRCQNSM